MAFQGSEHKIAGPRGSRNPIDTPTVNTTAATKKTPEAKEWTDPGGGGTVGTDARFSINSFKSEINSHGGLYRPNLYRVLIYPGSKNSWAGRSGRGFSEKISFLCNSPSLPGVQILTSDYRRQGYGTFDRRPFGVQVTDIPLTFFIDNNGYVLEMFTKWMNAIVNYNQSGGEHSYDTQANKGLFEIAYREQYIAKVEIEQFDQLQDKIQIHTLREAFPIQMGDVTVAWAENDSFAVLPVQFTFRSYDLKTIPAPKTTTTAGAGGPVRDYGNVGQTPVSRYAPSSTVNSHSIDGINGGTTPTSLQRGSVIGKDFQIQ